ncbi:MAG: hypothetical protein ACREQ4_08110 [Candidatus Binataceae bacterium]
MKLSEFFNSELVSLPKGGFDDAKDTFDQFLEGLFERYQRQLRLIDDPEFPDLKSALPDLVRASQTLSASVVKAVRSSLNGHVHAAYQEISSELSKIDWTPFRSTLKEANEPINLSDPFSPYRYAIDHPPLYRIRPDRGDFRTPDRGDIFHVPFEKRRLVGNQRYSITGLPCLYLGSSLWICWEELGRPPLDSLWVSRFRIAKPVKVLDFLFSPHQVWRMFEALRRGTPSAADRSSEEMLKTRFNAEFLESYAHCWPLFAACSIRREQRVGPFVPEFIVPQLLLQWAAQEGQFDGVRYFSVRTPTEGAHLLAHSNCVFPVKTISIRGHCTELKQTFALTEPISWEALTAVNFGDRQVITNRDSNAFAPIKLNEDIELRYSQTDFFKIELKLEAVESRPNCSRTINP